MANRDVLPAVNETEIQTMQLMLGGNQLDHRQAVRLQVVLARAQKRRTTDVAALLRITAVSVSVIVKRFNRYGIDGLMTQQNHKPGKAPIELAVEREVVRIVSTEKPEHATHWSTRSLAKRVGISHTKVHQILRKHRLKPHLVKRFVRSTDEHFEEKLADIVGLYLQPPENAIVLCVDEKTQIQALERTQPILPLREGIPERQTHDYWRHGVTTLYAALNVASGKVIGECTDRHRHQEYIDFLKILDRQNPKKKVLHLVVDNSSTHSTKEVEEYLQSRIGRFVVHYTPTHASWLNMVERWFAAITTQQIRRGSWDSLKGLKRAILDYIRKWNEGSNKFVWTKDAGQIMTSITKATRN